MPLAPAVVPLVPLVTVGASMPSMDPVLTMTGLAVILTGVGCGAQAYHRVMREYRNEPLFPLDLRSRRVHARGSGPLAASAPHP